MEGQLQDTKKPAHWTGVGRFMSASNVYEIGTQIPAGPKWVRSTREDMSFFMVIMRSVYASKSSVASVNSINDPKEFPSYPEDLEIRTA